MNITVNIRLQCNTLKSWSSSQLIISSVLSLSCHAADRDMNESHMSTKCFLYLSRGDCRWGTADDQFVFGCVHTDTMA